MNGPALQPCKFPKQWANRLWNEFLDHRSFPSIIRLQRAHNPRRYVFLIDDFETASGSKLLSQFLHLVWLPQIREQKVSTQTQHPRHFDEKLSNIPVTITALDVHNRV